MIVIVGSLWFLTSAFLSTWANTTFLKTFQDPLLHTFIRFFGSALFGLIYLLLKREVKLNEVTEVVYNVSVPAVLLWFANYFNSISLNAAGITLTYVVKACIPVFTVIVCSFGGQKFPMVIYASLLPICFGVALASGSDLDFSIYGLIAAFVSALAQTLMNITIKTVRSKTGYSGPKAFLGMTIVSTFLTALVIWSSTLFLNKENASDVVQYPMSITILMNVNNELLNGNHYPLFLVVVSAVAYHLEYMLNFIFVGYVNSVMFSVSDIVRRIAIIVVGGIVFNKVLTAQNWVGIVVALGGVLWYSYLDNKYSTGSVVTGSSTGATSADKKPTKSGKHSPVPGSSQGVGTPSKESNKAATAATTTTTEEKVNFSSLRKRGAKS